MCWGLLIKQNLVSLAVTSWLVKVTGRNKSNEGWIRTNSLKEQLRQWKNHFEQLLGQSPVLDDQPI